MLNKLKDFLVNLYLGQYFSYRASQLKCIIFNGGMKGLSSIVFVVIAVLLAINYNLLPVGEHLLVVA